MLCDDLEGWDGEGWGGRRTREGIHVYIQLTRFFVQQKVTPHRKSIAQCPTAEWELHSQPYATICWKCK